MLLMVKPLTFLREVRLELAKVVWPTRKEVMRLTLVVIGASVVVGLFIGAADYILTKIMAVILGR